MWLPATLRGSCPASCHDTEQPWCPKAPGELPVPTHSSPSPDSHQCSSCLPYVCLFQNVSCLEPCSTQPFQIGFLQLIICIYIPSISLMAHCFLALRSIPLDGPWVFTHSPIPGHFGCFQVWAAKTRAAETRMAGIRVDPASALKVVQWKNSDTLEESAKLFQRDPSFCVPSSRE